MNLFNHLIQNFMPNYNISNHWKIFQPLEILVFALFLATASSALAVIPFEPSDTINELREKIEANGYHFTVNTNWVFNLPSSEKRALLSRRMTSVMPDPSETAGPLAQKRATRALPSSFDWRDVNGHAYIGSIRNQGNCGSCYAFGASAAAECTYNFAMGLYDANAVDFSESFIIWCLSTMSPYSSHFSGCDGADYSYSELSAITTEGISYESAFPYADTPTACGTHWNDPRVTFDSWHRIACGDITAIKTAIMTYGAVDAAVYVGSAFSAYSGGIYNDANTACNGSPCSYTPSNHAIALIGWNDANGGYWILRNSWGTGWGESGYMRIAYDAAGVACAACYLYIEAGATISTLPATDVTQTTATLNGSVNPNGKSTDTYFQYGPTTAYGFTTTTNAAGSGSSTLSISTAVTELPSQSTWHFRLVGVSEGRTIPGSDRTFTTLGTPHPPDVTTGSAYDLTFTSARLQATLNPRGASTTYWFKYGKTSAYGLNTKSQQAGSGTASIGVSADLSSLTPKTTYHFCIAASNAYGTDVGTDQTFTTPVKPQTYLEEDFEHGGLMPSGWTLEYVRPCVDWTIETTGESGYPAAAHAGQYMANTFYDDWDGRSAYLVTPPVDFGTNTQAQLTFWHYSKEWLGDQDILRILYRKTPSAHWSLLTSFEQNTTNWTKHSIDLSELSTSYYIAFEGLMNFGYGISIDDVAIEKVTPPTPTPSSRSRNDFDGDNISDIGCYHPDTGNWYFFMSTSGYTSRVLGYANTVPITGYFDDDNICDYGTYYDNTGWWDIMRSQAGLLQKDFGYGGTYPVTGDFDGDGMDDYGCYYPPSGDWYIYRSSEGFWSTQFGFGDTQPITADFDGDGRCDFGCYYPPTGGWYIYQSSDGFKTENFGFAETSPIVGDFDGDGISDYGCYYPPAGLWYILKSRDGFWSTNFGYANTYPITGDFDGDGIADFGCYYPPTGSWYLHKSRDGFWTKNFGYSHTLPIK